MDLKLKKRHISAKQKSGTYPMMGQRRFQYIQKLCTKVLMAVKCMYYETHHFNFILFIYRQGPAVWLTWTRIHYLPALGLQARTTKPRQLHHLKGV